jgi:putative sterol carrier protein
MAEVTSPQSYFTHLVPQQHAAAVGDNPAAADQPELTAIYEIGGPEGGSYGLRAAGGQIEVVPADQIANPDMRTTMSYDDWKVFADSSATDPFVDYVARGKGNIVKGLKGLVRLELTRSNGETWRSTTTFAGQEEPGLTLMMTKEDYDSMLSGELNGQMAFLTGKLKFEGSLPLLMQIGALTA